MVSSPCPVAEHRGHEVSAHSGFHWVSCAEYVSREVSRHRHLIGMGSVSTYCGITAREDVWRTNSSKPECKNCIARYEWLLKSSSPIPVS